MYMAPDTTNVFPIQNTDFSKIKVGLKTLDDAILELGDYKRLDTRYGSKEAVMRAIYECDYATMKEVSNFYYKTSGIYSRLCKYAAKIGSDCPFFIYNQPMMASGRGEILTQYDFPMEDYKFEVINPKIHITTAEAYSKIIPRERLKSMVAGGEDISSLTDCPIDKLDTSLEEILSLEPSSWRELLINDFEPSTFERHPKLAEIKSDLYSKGAIYASLSGSGSAMFGMFKR